MDRHSQLDLPARVSDGFDGLLGLELIELSAERVRGRVSVRDELTRPGGAVHGGVYASLAESLASLGTRSAVASERKLAAAVSTQASFLRPIRSGTIDAVATARHRGRTTWVWEVEFSDDEGRLSVLARVTVDVRDA